MKIGLVHDWLIQEGGAEKVFKAIYQLYPGDIHTLFIHNPSLEEEFNNDSLNSSWLNLLPRSHEYYRHLLPFYPLAMKSLDLSSYDLIISSSHCMAKNIHKLPHQIHICYCHTPARYLWDLKETYQSQANPLVSSLLKLFAPYLRKADRKGAENVDVFIANSQFVKDRIERCYEREAKVIYPPVDTNFYVPSAESKEEYYVTCSRLIPYKNIDLILETFSFHPNKRLLVIGEGPHRKTLESKAPPNVSFLGWIPKIEQRSILQKAKAFIYAAVEDFGIVLAEAISSGCPIIALGQGGANEIVTPSCGILFDEASTNSLSYAITQLENKRDFLDPAIMHQEAEKFSYERFAKELKELVDSSIYTSRG